MKNTPVIGMTPNTEKNGISGNVTYTYIFGKKHHSSSDDDSKDKDKNKDKDNNKENNKDNNTGETTPTKVPALLNGSNHFAYVVGYKDGNVRPQGNITRAETAAIFFRLLKEEVRSENPQQAQRFCRCNRGQLVQYSSFHHGRHEYFAARTANSFAPHTSSPVRNLPPSAPALTAAEQRKTAALRIFPAIGRKRKSSVPPPLAG